MRTLTSLLLLLFTAVLAPADERLFIRPWVELEPLVRIDAGAYPIPIDVAQRQLLEEGRVLFSGMVYGWTFTYIPGDRERRVQESFVLTPVAEIPWGSPRLVVRETEVEDQKLWARLSYTMSADEALRRAAWESNTAELSTGRGKAAANAGPPGKGASLQDAIRDAIRLSLDTRFVNKPRQISGEVVLWDDPQAFVRSGVYSTVAKVKLLVRELIPYRIF
ncbi:MAG: hypothetical protein ABSG63_05305 [Spirochaetia bacterium]|jgi:hypothetical protein